MEEVIKNLSAPAPVWLVFAASVLVVILIYRVGRAVDFVIKKLSPEDDD